MKLSETIIAWNENSEDVAIGPLLQNGETDWTKKYLKTSGAAYTKVRELEESDAELFCLTKAIFLMVGDKVDPEAVHNAFMEIDEYRDSMFFCDDIMFD